MGIVSKKSDRQVQVTGEVVAFIPWPIYNDRKRILEKSRK